MVFLIFYVAFAKFSRFFTVPKKIMKVYLNFIEKELSFSIKKIIKIHYFYWNIYIIRILKFWLAFSVFLLSYSLEKNCCGVTEWQDIPLKSWENVLSNGIFCQTVRILVRFHQKIGVFYWTIAQGPDSGCPKTTANFTTYHRASSRFLKSKL